MRKPYIRKPKNEAARRIAPPALKLESLPPMIAQAVRQKVKLELVELWIMTTNPTSELEDYFNEVVKYNSQDPLSTWTLQQFLTLARDVAKVFKYIVIPQNGSLEFATPTNMPFAKTAIDDDNARVVVFMANSGLKSFINW